VYCSNCGKPVTAGENFCTECGFVIGNNRVSTDAPGTRLATSLTLAARGDKQALVLWAGIGSFVCAAIWLLVASDQFERAANRNNDSLATIGMWNLVIVGLYVALGVAILKRKKWGWDWGRGTNTVNLLLGVYQLTHGVTVQIPLLPIELFILFALYSTKASVVPNGRAAVPVAPPQQSPTA
jgi:hypothetical protein